MTVLSCFILSARSSFFSGAYHAKRLAWKNGSETAFNSSAYRPLSASKTQGKSLTSLTMNRYVLCVIFLVTNDALFMQKKLGFRVGVMVSCRSGH